MRAISFRMCIGSVSFVELLLLVPNELEAASQHNECHMWQHYITACAHLCTAVVRICADGGANRLYDTLGDERHAYVIDKSGVGNRHVSFQLMSWYSTFVRLNGELSYAYFRFSPGCS